jgi:hypothetical protein
MTEKALKYNDLTMMMDRRPAYNSGFAKKRVQWLTEHSTSHQLLCYVDSFELRNPLLRKAAKRYKAVCENRSVKKDIMFS